MRGPRTAEIVRLYQEGVCRQEIARRLGMSYSGVTNVLQRWAAPDITVGGLTRDEWAWLLEEARKTGTTIGTIAKALLVDAIAEARGGEGA